MRRQRFGFAVAAAIGMAAVLALNSVGGCAKTAQGRLNQVEVLYASTGGELNELREAGRISPDTYHAEVAPGLRSAYAAIKRARAEIRAGNAADVDVLLRSANDALLRLQPLRVTPAPTVSPTPPPSPPSQGIPLDPATVGLIIGGASRLLSAASKFLKGDDLTPDEQATLQRASDQVAADVDRLDPPTAATASALNPRGS